MFRWIKDKDFLLVTLRNSIGRATPIQDAIYAIKCATIQHLSRWDEVIVDPVVRQTNQEASQNNVEARDARVSSGGGGSSQRRRGGERYQIAQEEGPLLYLS